MGTRMQTGVDVGGDREHKQKHEAPLDNEPEALKVDGNVEAVERREPEGEPEALDLGGDGEALGDGEVLEPKGRCQHKRRPYWRFGRRRAACPFDMQRLGQTILDVLRIVERSLQKKYQHVARSTGAQLGR